MPGQWGEPSDALAEYPLFNETGRDKIHLMFPDDYEWAKGVIAEYRLSEVAQVLIGTVFNALPPRTVVQWILEDNLPVRFQLQLHKYIWDLKHEEFNIT